MSSACGCFRTTAGHACYRQLLVFSLMEIRNTTDHNGILGYVQLGARVFFVFPNFRNDHVLNQSALLRRQIVAFFHYFQSNETIR